MNDFFITDRGFGLIRFEDAYGKIGTIQESSAATAPHIWLGLEKIEPCIKAKDLREDLTGWVTYPIPGEVLLGSRLHLNQEQVRELLPILQKFVNTGEI